MLNYFFEYNMDEDESLRKVLGAINQIEPEKQLERSYMAYVGEEPIAKMPIGAIS
jgi:hypothetical protein